ncbi:schlafen-like protein 1 [Mytilus edulis]|uniref:schlafen-like protein 1 n=1 Tax=Mytilus edulis TaxID=6550 RepID=UPI0039EE42CD
MSTEFVIEVHNLKNKNDTILKDTIKKVFENKLDVDISVDKLDIEDCGDTKTATVYLQSLDEAYKVADGINSKGFKFTQIATEYKPIYACRVHSKRPANVYLHDEDIGDETRFREFKVGGGNIDNFLKTGNLKCLANYACGFVNNQEDGIIYVGVNDHGKVVGRKFDHDRRDQIRTQISRIMKNDIEPPLNTIHYSIYFAPVRTREGENQEDMYVLEIKFYTVDKFDKLYRVDGKVYEKRDACLSQPLSHKRILDWEEQIRHKQKNDELREQITKNQQLIDEKDQEINKEKCLRLEKETTVTTLEREKSELIKENKKLMGKSKVCVIL